jgi:hypothetical protein
MNSLIKPLTNKESNKIKHLNKKLLMTAMRCQISSKVNQINQTNTTKVINCIKLLKIRNNNGNNICNGYKKNTR